MKLAGLWQTQDADLFVEKSTANGVALVPALRELGFTLSEELQGLVAPAAGTWLLSRAPPSGAGIMAIRRASSADQAMGDELP